MRCLVFILLLFTPTLIFGEDKEMMQALKNAKRQHESTILAMADVVSMGIGKRSNGAPVIIIGLEKANLNTETMIRNMLKDYPIEIKVIGKLKAQ